MAGIQSRGRMRQAGKGIDCLVQIQLRKAEEGWEAEGGREKAGDEKARGGVKWLMTITFFFL